MDKRELILEIHNYLEELIRNNEILNQSKFGFNLDEKGNRFKYYCKGIEHIIESKESHGNDDYTLSVFTENLSEEDIERLRKQLKLVREEGFSKQKKPALKRLIRSPSIYVGENEWVSKTIEGLYVDHPIRTLPTRQDSIYRSIELLNSGIICQIHNYAFNKMKRRTPAI